MLTLLVPGVGMGAGVSQIVVAPAAPIRAKHGVVLTANTTSINPPGGLS